MSAILSMLTWNVLARQYTKYNSEFHRASGKLEETTQQTRARYTMAGEEIVRRGCDIVFLQECEARFLQPEWNWAASKLLSDYHMFRCSQTVEDPGTAVLVRKDGRAAPTVSTPVCVGGTKETGGVSKVATLVPVLAASRRFTAVSAHFAFDQKAKQRLHHADLIKDAVGNESLVLAGDFNCEPGPNLEALEASSGLFGSLKRIPLPEGSATGLSGDFTKQVCIDHFYVSADLPPPVGAVALAQPASPWGGKVTRPAKVSGSSDHVPVLACLDLAGPACPDIFL